ncbi:MAG: hypothetical protein RBR16_05775 [Syntrophus sp. (in: bacteria)]|nr:hypothetical protein [Syntrophus sp. (in: bacteria)]
MGRTLGKRFDRKAAIYFSLLCRCFFEAVLARGAETTSGMLVMKLARQDCSIDR